MKHRIVLLLLTVLLLTVLLIAVPAIAQDEATPEVTETAAPNVEPAPVVEPPAPTPAPEPGFNLRDFLLGVLTGGATTLAAIFGIIGRLKNDKAALDAIEWLGKSIPIEALRELNRLGHNARDAGEVIDRVTDGLPNLPDGAGS